MMLNPLPSRLKILRSAVRKMFGMISSSPIDLEANAGIQVSIVTPTITIKGIKKGCINYKLCVYFIGESLPVVNIN